MSFPQVQIVSFTPYFQPRLPPLHSTQQSALPPEMPFKFTLAASAALTAFALAKIASAAPLARSADQCKSLGKGPLGFDATWPTPQVYLTVQDGKLVKSGLPISANQTEFEFFQCTEYLETPGGKGDPVTYQGYVKAPDGNCVTIADLEGANTFFQTEPCAFTSNDPLGDVEPNQHFQIQEDNFYNFYTVGFLGNAPGPIVTNFGGGGNYHYTGFDGDVLSVSYQADQPQNGTLSQMLVAQLGSQYVPPPKQMDSCKLVKSGAVELVDTLRGQAQSIATAIGPNTEYSGLNAEGAAVMNGVGNTTYYFYQCDSTYMGYQSDGSNYYGHFSSSSTPNSLCFIPSQVPYLYDFILEGSTSGDPRLSACGTADDASQVGSFFHLAETSGGSEITYLGAPASERAQPYGWRTNISDAYSPMSAKNPQVVAIDSNVTEYGYYKLRFVN